jgi:LmbE family N-acetylglucosaminyl deacetylase
MLADTEIERILLVTAHPDDVDFGSAGSAARWTDAGIEVAYCIVTDGDAGGFDPDVPRAEIGGIRRAEQTAAAKVVGVADITFLGYPDGRLEVSLDLRRDISRVIRRVRPQRVVMQPWERTYDFVYRNHPDHLAAGEATMCAVYPDARNPFTFTELVDEGLEPWTVDEVFVSGVRDGDVFVDVTDQVDRKIDALLCHESQMTDPAAMSERVRSWLAYNAKAAGLPEGRFAESYRFMATA